MAGTLKGRGILMVRAVVPDADRDAFDRWYEAEHLPDAKAAFGALKAWRCWCETGSTVHFAFYEFPDKASANAVQHSDGLKAMVEEFDRNWEDRVTRSREVMECVGVEDES